MIVSIRRFSISENTVKGHVRRKLVSQFMLICYLRPARRKARTVASMEVLNLLHDLHPTAPPGGPLSEEGGLFWIMLPSASIEETRTRLPRLGYTYAVDLLVPLEEMDHKPSQEE